MLLLLNAGAGPEGGRPAQIRRELIGPLLAAVDGLGRGKASRPTAIPAEHKPKRIPLEAGARHHHMFSIRSFDGLGIIQHMLWTIVTRRMYAAGHRWAAPRTPATERQRLPPEELLRVLPREIEEHALMALPTTATRSYRIYLRDAENALAQPHDFDLASDEEARELAEQMIEEQDTHPCAEVWDRARLVCTVRKEDPAAQPRKRADSQSGTASVGEPD